MHLEPKRLHQATAAASASLTRLKSRKGRCHWDRTRRGCLHITPLCNTYRSCPFAVVLFDASATAIRYEAPASVMDGCIHLTQPAQSHFYSPVFEKNDNRLELRIAERFGFAACGQRCQVSNLAEVYSPEGGFLSRAPTRRSRSISPFSSC